MVALSGRVSTTRTTSPTPAALCSSWACSLLERRTTLPYLLVRAAPRRCARRWSCPSPSSRPRRDAPCDRAPSRAPCRAALTWLAARPSALPPASRRPPSRGRRLGRGLGAGRLLGRRLAGRRAFLAGLAARLSSSASASALTSARVRVLALGLHREQTGDLAPRVAFNLCGLSSCPVACWKRRLKSSLRVSLEAHARARRRRDLEPG